MNRRLSILLFLVVATNIYGMKKGRTHVKCPLECGLVVKMRFLDDHLKSCIRRGDLTSKRTPRKIKKRMFPDCIQDQVMDVYFNVEEQVQKELNSGKKGS